MIKGGWSPEKVANVRKLYAEGMSASRIAKALKCNSGLVHYYCRGLPKPADASGFHQKAWFEKAPAISVQVDGDFDE